MNPKKLVLITILSILGLSGCTVVVSTNPPSSIQPTPADHISGPYAALAVPPMMSPSPTSQPATATPTSTSTASPSAPPTQLNASPTPNGVTDLAMTPLLTPTLNVVETAVMSREEEPTAFPSPTTVTPTITPVGPTVIPVQPTAILTAGISQQRVAGLPTVTVVAATSTANLSQSSLGPTVRETTITINTYDYESALVPTSSDDPVYPYPRLNHDQVGPPSPQSYRAIILENRYLELTILPDLGGRIYRWIDKTSEQNLFYENQVIKPTRWGHRGWWLATGGMEWALPLDEHGLSEASPWKYSLYQTDNMAGVTLKDTEEHSGLVSEISITLDDTHSYFTLSPRIINPTAASVPYKFWLNGMFSLGSHRPGSEIDFILPDHQVIVHSTGDASLPGEGQSMDWPIFNGRNMSDYGNWANYLGVFAAPAEEGYMGAYNHQTNLGVVRTFPHLIVTGVKIFGPGDLDPSLWTIDGSSYFELWGGLAPTFWDEVKLEPNQWATWQERWYAIGNMGGFSFANEEAALNLDLIDSSVLVAVAATHALNGQLVLWQNGQEVTRWSPDLAPENPFRESFALSQPAPTHEEEWGLSLLDETGREVAAIGQTRPTPTKPVPAAEPAAAGLPTPTPTLTPQPFLPVPTPTPTNIPVTPTPPAPASTPINNVSLLWDPRLNDLGVTLDRAEVDPNETVYRLVSARFQDEWEAQGLHHVFVEVLDENGQRIVGQPVLLEWRDGKSTMITEDKPSPEYAANAPLYGSKEDGTYKVYVDGAPSDVISGLGLPGKHHVSYQLVFQRGIATDEALPPVPTQSASPTPTPTSTPKVKSVDGDELIWDPRLDDLGITLTQAEAESGQSVYRLVAAYYQDEHESSGLHHVFIEVLNENGQRIVGQPVKLTWNDGQATLITEDKPSPEYAANAPLYGEISDAKYEVYVDGALSDIVTGLGLPGKHHVNYLLTFQRKSN